MRMRFLFHLFYDIYVDKLTLITIFSRLIFAGVLLNLCDMALSEKAIKEFKEIYFKEYNEMLSDEEAQEMGQRLISLFKVIYRPIPGKDIPLNKTDTIPKPY